MSTVKFDKDLAIIELPQLKETIDEQTLGHKPLNGIMHYEVFDKITDICNNFKLSTKVDPIYISNSGPQSLPGISRIPLYETQFGKDSTQSLIVRRLLGRIVISDLEDDVTNTVIAISFHQQGIQLGYGPNVKICQNLSILGGRVINSSGSGKDLDEMWKLIQHYIQNHMMQREIDKALIGRMHDIMLDESEITSLIGDLELQAVGKAYLKGKVAPLNISQVSGFTKRYMAKQEEDPRDFLSLYDIYNHATGLQKPGEMDLTTIIPQNDVLGKYFMTKYDFKDIIAKYNLSFS